MLRTRVGYAGGKKKNPTYRDLGDHTESYQVDFDPRKITYGQLLERFWSSHSPTSRAGSRQYMAAVFCSDAKQKEEALESRARLEKKLHRAVRTPVLALDRFYPAEDYHQKYYLRNRSDLMAILASHFAGDGAFLNSTGAARLNAFVAGVGGLEAVLEAFRLEGLSREALAALKAVLAPRGGGREASGGCG